MSFRDELDKISFDDDFDKNVKKAGVGFGLLAFFLMLVQAALVVGVVGGIAWIVKALFFS